MTEIRNLTRNGETFYPQTHIEGVLDPEGEYIGYYTESPEWIRVILDNEGKILAGIKANGLVEWSAGIPQPIKKYIDESFVNKEEGKSLINSDYAEGIEYIENPEYVKVILDNDGKVLVGIKSDGNIEWSVGIPKPIKEELSKKVDKMEGKSLINSEVASSLDYKESPEFMSVELDSEEKVLGGRKIDGTKFENVGLNLGSAILKSIDDLEGRMEVKTDSDEKIISYRKEDGTIVENVGIETTSIKTSNLTLTPEGMTEFLDAIRASGFSGGTGDWSDAKTLQIPEPRLAMVNITNATNDATLPVSKSEKPLVMQFWDMAGNYFQKNILIAVQGDTSTWMAKKNFGFDICNDEWEGDDTFGLKIGNWVEQDSFHIKAGANDAFHGILAVMYKWVELAIKKLDTRPDRFAHGSGNSTITAATKGSLDKDFGTGALCHPDGFPCIVYLNGEFYGVYSWQLKKHRANYFMDKKDYESIHLDGFVGPTFFGGTIEWNAPGIEIKNPKTLYCMDGTKYDDDNGKELIDSTSPFYDPNNKDHKNTVKAKNTIIAMSQALSLVYAEVGVDAQKAKFEELFDKDAIETLYLMNSAMCNGDSVTKNTQWLYYKDCKIVPAFYDLDGAFGHTITGQFITGSIYTPTSFNVENYPLKFVYDNYKDELDAKWKILRDSDIVSVDTVKELLYDWIDRIGYEFYKKENKKWPCPSFRESHLNSAYWEPAGGSNWTVYNDTTQYNVGDLVSVDNWEYATKYRCKQACVGEPPCTELYEGHPISGGCFETPQRLLNNVAAQIEHLDSYYNYNN